MSFHGFEIERPLAHTQYGPLYLVRDAAGVEFTLRFISAAEYAANEERLETLLAHSFAFSGNLLRVIADGRRFGLLCEFVPGETLADLLLVPGGVRPRLATDIARQLRASVAQLHEAGVAHGDISPANVVVSLQPQVSVRLIDFATLTAGTPGYQPAGEADVFARDLFALGQICGQLGVEFPEGAAGNLKSAVTPEAVTPLGDGELSVAAMLRADLSREETQSVKSKSQSRVFNLWVFLRKTAGGLALVAGAVCLAFWLRQGPAVVVDDESMGIAGADSEAAEHSVVEAPQLRVVSETAAEAGNEADSESVGSVSGTGVCPSDSEAQAVLSQLLRIRNQALGDLDVQRLREVYVPESRALAADQKLFAALRSSGESVRGVSSEIQEVRVKQCEEQVILEFSHRLLEYQRCVSGECRSVAAGKARIEEITLQVAPWRIVDVKIRGE